MWLPTLLEENMNYKPYNKVNRNIDRPKRNDINKYNKELRDMQEILSILTVVKYD
jgi:hypothetical protein